MNFETGSEIYPVKETPSSLGECCKVHVNGVSAHKSPKYKSSSEVSKLIHIRGIEGVASRNVIRIMLLGNSGCGKSSFIRFITGNKMEISPSSQPIDSQARVGIENHLFELIDSPGFQARGPDSTWQELVDQVNMFGGIDIFLLAINAGENDNMRLSLELNYFERKHVDDRLLFWERAVIVFTHADYKGISTCEQEKNIQLELHDFSADKLRQIVINAENRCLYVNSLNPEYTYQTLQLQALYDQINKIQEPYPDDSLDDYETNNSYSRYLSNYIEDMNDELDEVQISLKKKKKKKFLRLKNLKKLTKIHRSSKETKAEDEMVKTCKDRGRRISPNPVKFFINPLKRLLVSSPLKGIDYDRLNSDKGTRNQPSELSNSTSQMNRCNSLPDMLDNKDRNPSLVRQNPYAIELYENQKLKSPTPTRSPLLNVNKNKQYQSGEIIFTAIDDATDIEDSDEFFTPPQSPSEL